MKNANLHVNKPIPATRQALFDFFEFNEADLAANRLGAFSDRQRRSMRNERKDSKRSGVLYELRLGGKEFDAFVDLPKVMSSGTSYVIYYDEADDTILSIEEIKDRPA